MDENWVSGSREERQMRYQNNIVKKPWGYEYLAYENNECALWLLHINKDQRTSMHCHPNKTTGLIILNGVGQVSFMKDDNILSPTNKIMIRKGLFHTTKAISDDGVSLFEIETPVDKHDLVRLKDSYGREGMPYEDSSHDYPKQEECLWIKNPTAGATNTYEIAGCVLTVKNVLSTKEFYEIDDSVNVIFLQAGIVTEYGKIVAGAGDIVSGKIIKKLIKVFDNVKEETVIMKMERA
jgi:mannose-6-phosphate isomerase-like protein (cupin superfamily)